MPKVETRAAGAPCWFAVTTPDLNGAQKFYGELFGWTFVVGPPEMGYYTMCKLGGANAAGMGLRRPGESDPIAWSIYFKSNDINASTESMRAHGAQVLMGPMDVMGEGHMVVGVDPTGAFFGFWQDGRHTGAQVENEPGAMTWAEACTRDGAKARDFYAAVLNAVPEQMPGMDYWMLKHDGQPTSGVMHMNEKFPAGIPPHWNVYFAVANTDDACVKIKELGGDIKHPAFDTPYGRMATVADPFGAVFSIIQLANPA